MCVILTSSVSLVHASCRTCGRVTSNTWIRHVTHIERSHDTVVNTSHNTLVFMILQKKNCVVLTSSVSLLRVSYRTCECVMSHVILRICVWYADLIGFTCACIMLHMWMSHVTYMWMRHVTSHTCDDDFYEYIRVVLTLSWIIHASCRTCEWCHMNASCLTWLKHRVNNLGHVWMSHVTCEWVTSHVRMYRVAHVNKCECVMSHANESCHT